MGARLRRGFPWSWPSSLGSFIKTEDGCPISRSFFARCGIYHCSFPLTLDSSDALSGQQHWIPTSREKRARYGAPVLCQGARAEAIGHSTASFFYFLAADPASRTPAGASNRAKFLANFSASMTACRSYACGSFHALRGFKHSAGASGQLRGVVAPTGG